MEEDRASRQRLAEHGASDPSALPDGVQRVAPAAAPSSSFANVQMRPEGQRYGDADLVPGGSLSGNGGMMMNERNFRGPGLSSAPSPAPGDGQPGFGSADGYARFDPMFPGQMPPGRGRGGLGVGGGRGRGAPRLPGEPDNDLFLPPQGGPGEPFGGPGGGQFGPRLGGGGSGWGGSLPWA
ncbi:hypothetical protein LSCM4_00355 [Leishmania orientalis]|uniref:Uncharacterized protein n=1 Tax=Leishmania orientalis TaxID=2249476 RepID=A0A836GVH5_9TRYP|nr:hypothetical protein LSCM4_00355 [Leishmania orientalis]